jgi:D-tyrosyl-tRNA(Tyr) deacylase
MRALIQRVRHGKVTIEEKVNGAIGVGLVIFLGVGPADSLEEVKYLAGKCAALRIFTDEQGKMNRSVRDIGGEILVVSQFTLYANCRRGNRPSFTEAAKPETAIPLYEAFVQALREQGLTVATGEFGADMQVLLENDGPVTIWMDTEQMRAER